jgi:hypothetical protein
LTSKTEKIGVWPSFMLDMKSAYEANEDRKRTEENDPNIHPDWNSSRRYNLKKRIFFQEYTASENIRALIAMFTRKTVAKWLLAWEEDEQKKAPEWVRQLILGDVIKASGEEIHD